MTDERDIVVRLREDGDYDPAEDLVRDPICRDAIEEITRLRTENADLRERCRMLEKQMQDLEDGSWGHPKDDPEALRESAEDWANDADLNDGAEFDWCVLTKLRVERYRVVWDRDENSDYNGHRIERTDAANAMGGS